MDISNFLNSFFFYLILRKFFRIMARSPVSFLAVIILFILRSQTRKSPLVWSQCGWWITRWWPHRSWPLCRPQCNRQCPNRQIFKVKVKSRIKVRFKIRCLVDKTCCRARYKIIRFMLYKWDHPQGFRPLRYNQMIRFKFNLVPAKGKYWNDIVGFFLNS